MSSFLPLDPDSTPFSGPVIAGVTVKVNGAELQFRTRPDGALGYELRLATPPEDRQVAEAVQGEAGAGQATEVDDPETFQADRAALQMALQELDGRVLKAAYGALCAQRSWPTIAELVQRYGSWNDALKRCGVPLPRKFEVTIAECYEAFMAVAERLGRSPSYWEYESLRTKAMPCAATVKSRYGGQWPTV